MMAEQNRVWTWHDGRAATCFVPDLPELSRRDSNCIDVTAVFDVKDAASLLAVPLIF